MSASFDIIRVLVASSPEGAGGAYSREAFKPMIETGTRIRQLVVVLVVVTKYDREGYRSSNARRC
jgi:hypothetical protein